MISVIRRVTGSRTTRLRHPRSGASTSSASITVTGAGSTLLTTVVPSTVTFGVGTFTVTSGAGIVVRNARDRADAARSDDAAASWSVTEVR